MRLYFFTLLLLGWPDSLRAQDPAQARGSYDTTGSNLVPRLGTTLVRSHNSRVAIGLEYDIDRVPVVDSVQAWYWPKGQMGRKAEVVFQGVVDTNGRVEPASIRLISPSDSLFVASAKLTFMVVYFQPGMSKGRPVRVLVQQALAYGRVTGRWCELKGPTPLLPPKCR